MRLRTTLRTTNGRVVKRRRAPRVPTVRVDGPVVYYRVVLQNGTVVHLFGEDHRVSKTCKTCDKPGCMTLGEFTANLARQAFESGQRLDVFIEDEFGTASNRSRSTQLQMTRAQNAFIAAKNPRLLKAPLQHLKQQMGTTRAFDGQPVFAGPVRVHQIDTREEQHHPYMKMTWSTISDIPKSGTKMNAKWLERALNSENYATNITNAMRQSMVNNVRFSARTYAKRFPRDAITVDGPRSISRVRKQLLKLQPRIGSAVRNAVVRIAQRRKYDDTFLLMAMLMDAYTILRLLYYAGYGITKPRGGAASVIVAHGGAGHTEHWKQLLVASGEVKSITGGGTSSMNPLGNKGRKYLRGEVSKVNLTRKGCIRAPLD